MKSEMERDILKVLVTEEARSCMSSFMARTRCFWAC